MTICLLPTRLGLHNNKKSEAVNKSNGPTNRRGSAGGSAGTVGATYASSVAAWCAVRMLLGGGTRLPWNTPAGARIVEIACESETEVDDLKLSLESQGTIYIQIKHGLVSGPELRKAVAQLVRQYHSADFSATTDRLVIATDHSASGTIRTSLRMLLQRFNGAPAGIPLDSVAKNKAEHEALSKLRVLVRELWRLHVGCEPQDPDLRTFFGCMCIFVLDPLDGTDVESSIDALDRVVDERKASDAWRVLNDRCLKSAWLRQPFDLPGLRQLFADEHVVVAPRGFPLGVARKMTTKLVDSLIQMGRYRRETYTRRASADEQLAKFLGTSARVMIVSGGSGQGKTSWSTYQCDAGQSDGADRLRNVLIRGDDLDPEDGRLFDSFSRLLRSDAVISGDRMVTESEMREWLREEELLIFVDGLDRAPAAFRENLRRWLEGTLVDLQGSRARLLLTARPESVGPVVALLKNSEHLYRPSGAEQQVHIGDFDRREAGLAAQSLGYPELARFRHPSMMAFCAQMRDDGVDPGELRSHDIIERYIQNRMQAIQLESGLLPEAISAFVLKLAKTLADSPDGELSATELEALRSTDDPTYGAVRRSNLLAVNQSVGRVEPDEVSEHLQGEFTDIEFALDRLQQLLERPLKLGALRAAMVHLAMRDKSKIEPYLERLLNTLEEQPEDALFSVACAVVSVLDDWDQVQPLAARMAAAWSRPNLVAIYGFGKEFLDLLTDQRWAPLQRLELLWKLALNESGYDWRSKHWMAPQYAPNFTVTPWRTAMLSVLAQSGEPGLDFLVSRFDLPDAFSDTQEARLGDVAQGLFVLAAEANFDKALAAAARATSDLGVGIRHVLARRFPHITASHLADAVKRGMVPIEEVSELLDATLSVGPAFPELIAAARELMALPQAPQWRRSCLRVLSQSGEEAAAYELLQLADIGASDVRTCLAFSGQTFVLLIDTLFTRVAQGSLRADVLSGLDRLPADDQDVTYLLGRLGTLLSQRPEQVLVIAEAVEYLIHGAFNRPGIPVGLLPLVEQVLSLGSADANRYVIYAATGYDHTDRKGSRGVGLRSALIQLLVRYECDANNIQLMIGNLGFRHASNPQVTGWMAALARMHPSVDVWANLRVLTQIYSEAAEAMAEAQRLCAQG